MKNIIIASTSTLHGGEYLDYLLPELQSFFSNVKNYFLFHMQDLAEFRMMITLKS